MVLDAKRILGAMAETKRPLGLGELISRLGVNPGMRTELKRAMRELVRSGEVVKSGKRFALPAPAGEQPIAEAMALPQLGEAATEAPPLLPPQAGRRGRFIIGTLRKHAEGFGFVRPISGVRQKDLYLPSYEASRALDGDLVRVQVVPGHQGRPSARLIDVVERRRIRALGTYVQRGKASYVLPAERALGEAICVPPSPLAKDGDLVKVSITEPPTSKSPPAGAILERIERDDPRSEALESAYEQGFVDGFPGDVLEHAEDTPLEIDPKELARRRDLRPLQLVTIDGEDARDFDDAVYVERTRSGWRLVVAIADVAHYVRPATPMDHEALRRTTSVYFPGMVLPMLPQRLSNGICSLMPDQDRLCMVADMVFASDGAGARCVDAQIYEGVMRSAARCTYTEVAKVLGGEHVEHREQLRDLFKVMEELTRRLMASREARGSIDFDLPEAKVVLDERFQPVRIEKRPRNIAHRIIEELMLAANEQVARYFDTRGLPTVYRVHGEPDEEKLETFLALARAHGFALKPGRQIEGKALNELLKKIAGSAEQRTLNFLLLRAMMQAAYSAENIGHFGLAAPFYLHFTSPIRRYPDLMVHRLLKEHWARGARSLSEDEVLDLEERLGAVAARCSERERAAMSAERDVQSYFTALFMADKIGEEHEGSVAAVTEIGVFVELADVFAEGLVKMEQLGEGAALDEARHRIVLPSGLVFSLGTKVKVRVVGVDPRKRHIDFELLEVEGQKPRAGRPSRGPRRPAAAQERAGERTGERRRPAEEERPRRKGRRSGPPERSSPRRRGGKKAAGRAPGRKRR